VKYLLSTGMKEESVGTVVKYEAEHGITIKALRRYADDLVEMGVSRDQVGHVIEETAKHGTPASSLVQGLGMSLETLEDISLGELKITVDGKKTTLYKLGEVGLDDSTKYVVGTIKGDQKKGLIHILLRHVWGYEMTSPKKPVTAFWPLGQRIMVNGEVKQLPKVFNSEEELVEFLKEVMDRALKDPEYKERFLSHASEGKGFGISVDLKELGMNVDGIDVVQLEFKFEDGAFVLRTAYPKEGSAVWEYNRYLGWRVKR